MSNHLVLRARAGLDRDMDSLIDNLRHRFAASQSGSHLSQAMLLQAMSQHSNNSQLRERARQTGAECRQQAQANPGAGRPGQRAQIVPPAARSTAQRAQCAPLDLSVKTHSISHSSSSLRSRVGPSQSRGLGQRRHQHHTQQQQPQQQPQQYLSLDMLKTIAQVITREKSSLDEPAGLDQVHSRLNEHFMQQTQLVSSSASSSVSDYNGHSTPDPLDCHPNSASSDHNHDHNNELEMARRLATPAPATTTKPAGHQTEVISSTNRRRSRHQSANNKRQKASKSHLCNHCGRSFVRSDMLTRHSRLHSGHKPYQCGKCLQVFSRSDHLSTHERTHTGEKPYQCGICAYSACRRDMITRHMRTHLGPRVKHRPGGAEGSTPPAASQAEAEAGAGSNGANSNETNSSAQSPSSIATTILMADDDQDEEEEEEEGEETKRELTSFLYHDNRSL